MKRGFTLIELLAVIVILAVILAIAIPGVSSLIESSQVSAFKGDEQMLIRAAKTYIGINDSALPVNIGDAKEITLETLQTANYINTIVAPDNKDTTCNGYVLITKISNNDYDYTPYLNCENDIGSKAEDGLIANYKFDDFQEPTQNLFIQNTAPRSVHSDWSLTVVGDKTYKLQALKDNPGTNQWNYVGVVTNNVVVPANQVVTISCEIVEQNTNQIEPYMMGFGPLNSKNGNIVYKTNSYNLEWSYGLSMYAINPTLIKSGDYIIIKNPQLEYKSYPTPFVDGTRTATVKDYSGNNNTGTILVGNTPKWLEDNNRKGVYYFDGVNDYFDVGTSGSLGITDYFTFSAWVNFDNVTDATRVGNIIGNFSISPNLNMEGYTNGRLRFYWNGQVDFCASSNLRSSWHHVAAVRNKITNSVNLYIDGEYNIQSSAGTNLDFQWPLRIGGDFRATPGIPYHGYLDDIRIYNRALSATEIKQLYNSSK